MTNTTPGKPAPLPADRSLALSTNSIKDSRKTWRLRKGRVEFLVVTEEAWADHLDGLAKAIRQQEGDDPAAYARFAYALDYNRKALRKASHRTRDAMRALHRYECTGNLARGAFTRFILSLVTPAEVYAVNDNCVIDAARYFKHGKAGFPVETLAIEEYWDFFAVLEDWRAKWEQHLKYCPDTAEVEAAKEGMESFNAEVDDIAAYDGDFEPVEIRRAAAPLCVTGTVAVKFGWMIEGGAA